MSDGDQPSIRGGQTSAHHHAALTSGPVYMSIIDGKPSLVDLTRKPVTESEGGSLRMRDVGVHSVPLVDTRVGCVRLHANRKHS